jgi:NAD+ kinase
LELLYEKNYKKKNILFLHTELDQSFDMLISIGGVRAATLIRDSGIPILGINAEDWGFGNRSKENIDDF